METAFFNDLFGAAIGCTTSDTTVDTTSDIHGSIQSQTAGDKADNRVASKDGKEPNDFRITITTIDKGSVRNYHVTTADEAAEVAYFEGGKHNTYYSTALRKPGLSRYQRGGEDDIAAVVCLYADIDIAGPAHKQTALPGSIDEAISFLNGLSFPGGLPDDPSFPGGLPDGPSFPGGLPDGPSFPGGLPNGSSIPNGPSSLNGIPNDPSIPNKVCAPASYIIDSGNGLHALWLLEEPFLITTPDDLRKIKAISLGFGAYIIREGQKHGWHLDNVQDVARMLRAPGTLNFKTEVPKPCSIIIHNDVRYPLTAFEAFKVEPKVYEPITIDKDNMGSADRMRGHCAFIDTCIRDAGSLSEPWWHAFLSIVALTAEGQEKCHEWSCEYYNYDSDETQERIKRAIKENKPCSCEYIRDVLGFNCPEGGCLKEGSVVKGPIVFSLLTMDERVERLLNSDISSEDALLIKNLELAVYAKRHSPIQYARIRTLYQKLKIGMRLFDNMLKEVEPKCTSSAEVDFFGTGTVDLQADFTAPEGYDISMSGITRMVMGENGPQVVKIANAPVLITSKLEDLDDGTEKLELSFYRNNRWKTALVNRADVMDKHRIVKLADFGMPVSTENAPWLVGYLSAFEDVNNIRLYRSIERLGWFNDYKEFYPYHLTSEVVFESSQSDTHRLVGAVKTGGSEDTWLRMAKDLRTLPVARAMLAASFASPLVELLQSRIIYFHLWYDSRSGKSAVQKAAMSIWGDPERLISSYNSTSVGFERMAAAMNNLPLALDELQSASMKPEQLSHVIYMLGNGIGKMRGEKAGGLQVIRHWKNVILSTGEQPIVRNSSMDGESSRVMDIRARPIYDEDFARRVHQISEENYGWAGQKYMEYVTSLDRETLKAMLDDVIDLLEFACNLSVKGAAGKHLHSVAIIALADELASRAVFGESERGSRNGAFLVGAVLLMLLNPIEGERDSVDRAWSVVENWVAANADHIQTENGSGLSPVYGRVFEKKLYLNPEYLKEAIEKAGFSYEKCYAGFKDRGYIDGSQKSIRFAGVRTKGIGTKIDFDRTADDSEDGSDFLS